MRFFTFLALTVVCCFTPRVSAQKAETEKLISGCWKITALVVTPEPPNFEQIKNGALNSTTCMKNGRFTSAKPDGSIAGEGSYQISEDGKTMTQTVDEMPPGSKSPAATILKLTDTELVIEAGEITLRFVRIKP